MCLSAPTHQTFVYKPIELTSQALDHKLVAPVDPLQHALEPRLLSHASGNLCVFGLIHDYLP